MISLRCLHSIEQLRLFIALSTPEEVKTNMAKVQAELRCVLPNMAARWTRREQLHLTLRFLGDVASSRIDELAKALQGACLSFGPLQLKAAGLGCFPDARFPRVVWAAVKDHAEQLSPLWGAVQSATQSFTAEPPEKNFVGHVTLARLNRLRRSEADELQRAVGNLGTKILGGWTASQIELMRSQLSPQGACHTLVAAVPLLGG